MDGSGFHDDDDSSGRRGSDDQGVDDHGEKHQRIALACYQCRSKKAKCSGTTPVCVQCARQSLQCDWPSGRKRKRTRKEMLEAAANAAANGGTTGRRDVSRSVDRPQAGAAVRGGGGGSSSSGGGLGSQQQQRKASSSSSADRSSTQIQAGSAIAPPTSQPQPAGSLLGGANDFSSWQQMQDSFSAQSAGSSSTLLLDPLAVGTARSPPLQQGPFQTSPTAAGGLADWMATSFGSTSSQPQQQQQQRTDAALTARSLSSTSPFPPAPPYPSTFSSVHIPYKVPPDALPLVDLPIASGSGTGGGLGGYGMSNLSLGNGSGSSNGGGRSSAFSPSKGTSGQSSQQQQQQQPDGASQNGILRAVTDQVGYLEGESGEPYLKLYYYRVSGNTAIHPGINRICLKLQLRPPPPTSPAGSATAAPGTVPSVPQPRADLQDVQFDPQTDMASPAVYEPLIELFYKVAGQHFPSIQRARIAKRFEQGQMSAFLCNAMCALAARHSPLGRSNPANAGNAFLAKAHELVVPLLRMPTTDGVTGLLLLAWAEHGQNSESGFWQFSGLAIRMAVDLGFFSNTDEMYEDYAHFVRTKNLLWSLFQTDRLLALSTGRPCTIQESDIEIPLPLEEEVPEGPRPPGTENDPPLPSPFVWCTKLMVLCGRIANLLNGSRGHARTFVLPDSASTAKLKALQTELVDFYSRIPPSMVWSVDNFKNQAQSERGGVFLMFHCWANAVIALLHHPAIMFSPSGGSDTPMTKAMNRSIKLALASSRTICECAVFADLCSPISYTASPGLSQTLYIAGLAFIAEMKHASLGLASGMNSADGSRPPSPSAGGGESSASLAVQGMGGQATPQASDAFLTLLAQQNLNVIVKALQQMTHFWAGAGVMLNILKQRSQGMTYAKIDFSATSDDIKTFVSLPDSGVLRRFTSDLAPPGLSPAEQLATIASMSPACSPESNLAPPPDFAGSATFPDEWNLDSLLSSYSVEDMSVEPAGGFWNFDGLGESPSFGTSL